jgi:hypothetical protein
MNKRKVLTILATFGPLILCAAAAFAATSGLPADAPVTALVNVRRVGA